MSNSRTMELDLFGQRLTVRSDNDPESVRAIVDFVNGRLHDAKESSGAIRNDHVALMAALNIAEELFKERARANALRSEVRQATHGLISAIEALEAALPW